MSAVDSIETSTRDVEVSIDDAGPEEWRTDSKGRSYVPRQGKSGVIYRAADNETVDEARARDSKGPKDRRPKQKTSRVPKSPAPTQRSIAELERGLCDLLRSPQMVTAMKGDEWATLHFDREAPVLARNLAVAAESNPWLRSKLEAAVFGDGTFLFKLLALAPVISAAIAYVLPPIIYYLDPGFIPPEARDRFNVPRRPTAETRKLLRERRARELDEQAEREQREIDQILADPRAESADAAPTASTDTAAAA